MSKQKFNTYKPTTDLQKITEYLKYCRKYKKQWNNKILAVVLGKTAKQARVSLQMLKKENPELIPWDLRKDIK